MKKAMKKVSGYFTRGEFILWCSSVTLIIAPSFAYYGEIITYLGMIMPMAEFSLAAWLRHTHEARRSRNGWAAARRKYLFHAVNKLLDTGGVHNLI